MSKNGFVLVTALILIALLAFIATIQFTYLQVLGRQTEQYYRKAIIYNNNKSELAYQQWLKKKK